MSEQGLQHNKYMKTARYIMCLAVLFTLFGCGTLLTQLTDDRGHSYDWGFTLPRVYSGTVLDFNVVKSGWMGILALPDLPISFITDTLLLPYTIGRQKKYGYFENPDYKGFVLTKKQYIEMEDKDIRDILLKATPPGTPKDEVGKYINNVLGREFRYRDGSDWYHVRLASYDWGKFLFLAGAFVEGDWYFDKEGKLKDIKIYHGMDGI